MLGYYIDSEIDWLIKCKENLNLNEEGLALKLIIVDLIDGSIERFIVTLVD